MQAKLIVADSESNADLLYATGLFVPDPFIWFEVRGKSYAVLSDLEVDRARRQATVDRVLPMTRYLRALKREGSKAPRLADVLVRVLREHRVRRAQVPANFPLGLARKLTGVKLAVAKDGFFPARETKSATEVRHLVAALAMAEAGLGVAVRALRRARIGRDGYLYSSGRRLKSEVIQGLINATIAARGGIAAHTIVAGGNQGCDPHEAGHGPLRAHQPIIIDIFPRDTRTGYWGDITRTVVRGRASDGVKQLFVAVALAQDIAFRKLRAGVDGKTVHEAIQGFFKREGFVTGKRRGYMAGFFHGTGHGLGLDIHELPRVSSVPCVLKAGHVVTVEPGLYYRGIGGMRLEDVVVIGPKGCRNLTRFPKYLEI